MILACNNINKSFGTDQILSDVSFHINDHEKAAIVGLNGAGKSTLLKIIVNQLSADSGEITLAKGIRIGYLAQQHQGLSSGLTIYDEMLEAKKDILQLDEKIRRLEKEMKEAEGEKLKQLLHTYTNCTHEFEQKNGYAYKSEITGVLKGLGFPEEQFSMQVSSLSGGQKTRVALGKLLLSKPDLILLDEPTNHLDMESISWLETFLGSYVGSVVIVSHDRYFLDKVVTKIIELDHAKAQVFTGNYTDYSDKKAQQRENLFKQYLNQQKEIKHQEEVITKLRSFNREKSIKRAESREKMLNKIERMEKPITAEEHISLHFEPRMTSGNDVLTVTGLTKAFGDHCLFTDLNFEVKRGEKLALIGNNGTGKTTILKLITNLLPADNGDIRIGAKVKIAYYDQEHQVLHPEKTLFDELQDTYPDLNNTRIRNILAAFLFTGDDVFKRIKDLSGGEKGRLSLAKLMLSDANFLVLDEPTNHLDITSKEILEEAIRNYTGTVLYVSHDRYFINKTATRILDLTNTILLNYIGNYDYYMEKKDETEQRFLTTRKPNDSSQRETASSSKEDWQRKKEEQAKARKRQNDLAKTEDEIQRLEKRGEEIELLLSKEEIYTDVEKLLELNNEKTELDARLESLLEYWEKLANEE